MEIKIDTSTPEDLLARQWRERKTLFNEVAALLKDVETKMVKLGMEIPADDDEDLWGDDEPATPEDSSIVDSVRSAALKISSDWTKADIIAALTEAGSVFTPAGVSSAIQQLRRSGEVVETVPGGRGKAGRYKAR